MNESSVEPLDDDVRALVRSAAGIPPAPAAARARVLAGVEAALAVPGGATGGDAPGRPPASVDAARRLVLVHRGAALVVSFALGAGAATIVAHRRAPQPAETTRIVYVDREAAPAGAITAPPAVAPGPVGTPAVTPGASTPTSRDPAAHERTARPTASSDLGRLEAERLLLDRARGALEQQRPTVALDATAKHARAFPDGILAQEREGMSIRALVMLGQLLEARERAARFRARFPKSLLWPAIEAAVENRSPP